jgi:hypothetical protein
MIGERLTYYIEKQGYSKKEFCEKFGFNYNSFVSTLADKLPLGMNVLKQVKEVLPNLNTEWLLFGNGEMEVIPSGLTAEPTEIYKKIDGNNLEKINALLTGTIKDKNKIITGLEFQVSALTKELEVHKEEIHIKSNVDKQSEVSNDNKKLVK